MGLPLHSRHVTTAIAWDSASLAIWCSGDFVADSVVNAVDLNMLALKWLQDVSSDVVAAPGARTPRAPLANHVVVVSAAMSRDSNVFTLRPSHNTIVVESRDYPAPTPFVERYVRRDLRQSSAGCDDQLNQRVTVRAFGLPPVFLTVALPLCPTVRSTQPVLGRFPAKRQTGWTAASLELTRSSRQSLRCRPR